MPHHGLGYGAFRYLGTQEQRDALACVSPRVVFNYLGQFDKTFDEKALGLPADEAADSSLDPMSAEGARLLHQRAGSDGELRLNVGFSAQRYRRESVEAWVEQLEKELIALIAHCTSGARGLTPSIFRWHISRNNSSTHCRYPREQVEDLYPMTTMQQGLLFHSLQEPGGAYVNQWRVDIEGLDVQQAERLCVARIEMRHDIRGLGSRTDGLSLQWVAKSAASQPIEERLTGKTGESASVSSVLDARAHVQRELRVSVTGRALRRWVAVYPRESFHRHHLI